MNFLIGFALIIIGGVSSAIFPNPVSFITLFVGVFLFASLPDDAMFCDYVIPHNNDIMVRKRYYIVFLPFYIVSMVITLGFAKFKIVRKEEYFRFVMDSEGNYNPIKITRREYIALRNNQRIFYSTRLLSKEFMEKSYSIESIGYKRKKLRLIIASVVAALISTVAIAPGGIYLVLIYEIIFIPMILLWIPEYKDAKILHQAYTRAIQRNGV